MGLIDKAESLARVAHGAAGQTRKYSGEDYIIHPRRVAYIIADVTSDENLIAAAWLHDTVEDTEVTLWQIEHYLNDQVRKLVNEVTNISRPSDGNRRQRKMKDRAHLAKASREGKTLKLADMIDNMPSIIAEDPKFANVYIPEKALYLEVLKEGNSKLYKQANDIIQAWKNSQSKI